MIVEKGSVLPQNSLGLNGVNRVILEKINKEIPFYKSQRWEVQLCNVWKGEILKRRDCHFMSLELRRDYRFKSNMSSISNHMYKISTKPPHSEDPQARIQVFELEGAKFGEGSGDRLGPKLGPGRSPGGGTRGRSPPEAPAI